MKLPVKKYININGSYKKMQKRDEKIKIPD